MRSDERKDATAPEILALKALAWLAGREDLLPVFLGSSGLAAADLRRRAGEPEILGAVLDFLLMDDDWIRAFCDDAGLGYHEPMRARAALPGGQQTHWT
ncbi:DUF3572 domain-containing protein [Albidovulum sp.]